jgi:uncharacterized protein involved in tolerance to divalent cations
VRQEVKRNHSYKTPAIVVMPLEGVDPDYFSWIMAQTEAAAAEGTLKVPPK